MQMTVAIKREQSQACLCFAERKQLGTKFNKLTLSKLKHMNKILNKAMRSDEARKLKLRWRRQWKLFRQGLLCAAMVAIVSSCDEHRDFPDTSMKIGHVVCTDGQIMDAPTALQLGKEPIAVVFHINQSSDIEGSGHAVYLYEMEQYALTDSLGVAQGTSADISAFDGNTNTYAMLSNSTVSSPAAIALFEMWKYGQAAYIPSVAQMRMLYQARYAINQIILELGGDVISDEPSQSWYWTSTEVDGQQPYKAWLYSLSSGAMQETSKLQAHKVRPVITLNN